MREEIRNEIIQYLKGSMPQSRPLQFSDFYKLIHGSTPTQNGKRYSIIHELIQELINNGLLYVGTFNEGSLGYPWLTLTEYGKKCLLEENLLPYNPEGYLLTLKEQIPDLDDLTLLYIGESISTYNQKLLLASTTMLGVASENLILLLIDAYIEWIKDPQEKERFRKKISSLSIYNKFDLFIKKFNSEMSIPKNLRMDRVTYLDGIFNNSRLHRNRTGHPTGMKVSRKLIYSNLQIFVEYSDYIFKLISFFNK